MALLKDTTLKNLGKSVMNSVSEVLSNSDFISRTIGMQDTYDDLMFIIQALGREPVSLLGKDYPFIFDHVRRNYMQGTYVMNNEYDCPKFTFYKEMPTVRFADPYTDPNFLIDRWFPEMKFETSHSKDVTIHYSESNDGYTNNKQIGYLQANTGTRTGEIRSYGPHLTGCDLIKKTNDNFNHGKYKTLIARFHTNSEDSRDPDDPTQTAYSKAYGLSHGRNLLKLEPSPENGYDNPYCRVWTYHYQYHTLENAIRPFGFANSAEELEKRERSGDFDFVGFRTTPYDDKEGNDFKGGSARLDDYGVLNYKNNMVNIAPTAKIRDYFDNKIDGNSDENKISIKKCMFSIENLAWKDTKNSKFGEFEPEGLSAEQKGPLGGRIMWFPPYNITFSESVSVDWNPNDFIGRGEKIYTYKNTERRGALSFTLLIDHPSIIDYWTGHERNGMKNRGNTLLPGNTDGVDGKDNQEQTLLRFFAGCDVLTAKPQEYWMRKVETKPEEPKPEPPKPNPPAADEVKPQKKVLYCLLYYPNNYSGADDTPNGSDPIVNAVDYLMNGVGTQKYVVPSHCNNCGHDWLPTEAQLENTVVKRKDGKTILLPLICPKCASSNTVKNLDAADFGVDKYNNLNYGGDSTRFGGYEVREITGNISIANEPIDADYTRIKKTYADPVTNEKKAQKLTNNDGKNIEVKYGDSGESYVLAKQIGSEAMSLGNASNGNGGVSANVTKSPYQWYRKRWYYRVDKDTENQKLTLPSANSRQGNYIDTTSFAYNGTGYLDKGDYLKSTFGIKYDEKDHDIIAFTDLYVGLENDSRVNKMLEGCYSDERVKTIVRPFIEDKDRIKVTKITFYGHASVQGNNASDQVNKTRNNKLAKNRALTFKRWMESKGFPGAESAQIDYVNGVQSSGNKNDVNDRITKIWRSASVVIEYEEGAVENAAVNENSRVEVVDITDAEGKVIGQSAVTVTERVSVKTDEKSGTMWDRMQNGTMDFSENNVDFQNKLNEANPTYDGMLYRSMNGGLDFGANNTEFQEKMKKLKATSVTEESDFVKRYDNEGEFFQLLERNEPFLHHLITDKIKYFDPAFHSISPEGFNARLTFLHQCTRQGSTLENSAFESGTAYNLAFGRPPVCVLRLGDFYYTKIIINGLNINYEQPQWDLNPEGIGVMPMFANITIDFAFLGGSDLAGPIARLQNAVSFNYYANTSVYDNRAEMVEYDPEKTGKEVKFKGYRYPNTPNKKKYTPIISFGGDSEGLGGTPLFKESGPEHRYTKKTPDGYEITD